MSHTPPPAPGAEPAVAPQTAGTPVRAHLDLTAAMLLESVPSGIATVDVDGRQTFVNPAFCRMVGWSREELEGASPPFVYWPPEEMASIGNAWKRMMGNAANPQTSELRFMRRDGTRLGVLVTTFPLRTGETLHGWAASVVDIDDRKRLEGELGGTVAQLHAERRRLDYAMRASDILNASLDYRQTLSSIAELALQELADRCLIDVVEADGEMERTEATRDTGGAARVLHYIARDARGRTVDGDDTARVIATGRPAVSTGPSSGPEGPGGAGVRSTMIVPMTFRGRAIGAITLHRTGAHRRYGVEDLHLAEELAARAAVAVDNARLFRSEQAARTASQQAAERTARLQAFTAALSEATTVQAVADVTLHHGMQALDAVAGGVCLVTADGTRQALVSVAAQGVDHATLASWDTFPLDAPYPVNDAVRSCELVVLGSIEEFWGRYPLIAQHIAGAGYQAYLAAPLELGGCAIGSINYNFSDRRSFSDEDRAFMQALARQATVALERARLFESEREARERAEEANRAKSQFLAMMSHELRTPLNAVLGFADLLAAEVEGPINARQRAHVDRIRAGAMHLVGVIEEILTYSRVEARREELRLSEVDLVELAGEVLRLLEREASVRGLRVTARLPDTPLPLNTDAGKVRQILINLVGNAVKFTERGGVELRLEEHGADIRFEVRDTGPGIPEEQLERIFEPFVQLDNSTTRRQGGTGLGLAVSRRLAHLLGGELSVSSRAGRGTTFRLRLRRGEDRDPRPDDAGGVRLA